MPAVFSVVLEKSPCHRGSSRTNFQVLVLVLVLESQVLDNNTARNTELSEYQPYTSYVIATPALTPAQSADTDSLLSPRKFLRT